MDEALKGVGDRRQANAALWATLGKRRDYRSLLVARAAHVLNAATGEEDWRSFVATAAALIDGAAPQTLPVMEHVLDASLATWQAEEYILDGRGSRPERAVRRRMVRLAGALPGAGGRVSLRGTIARGLGSGLPA